MTTSICGISQDLINENMQVKVERFVNINGTYRLSQIEEDLLEISDYYKNITKLEVIGSSYEEKPIYALTVGNNIDSGKDSVLFIGNIHAREDFSSMFLMKTIDELCYTYYDNNQFGSYNTLDLLNTLNFVFIPVANPDGLVIAHDGIESSSNYEYLKNIPNKAKDDQWWKANGRGVDLNRNFDDGNWQILYIPETSSLVPASEGYKGDSPNSEPETRAIQAYCERITPLMSVSYHTSGEIIYWADTDTHHIFNGVDRKVADNQNKLTSYRIMPISKNPATFSGGFENWFRSRFHRLGFCIELSPYPSKPYIQYPDSEFEDLIWEKAKYSTLQIAEDALYYRNQMYDFYSEDTLVKTFYSEEDYNTFLQATVNTDEDSQE